MGVNTQYTATATYSNGSTADVTNSVDWSSSAEAVARVSNTSGSGSYTKGLTTPVSVGTTNVTASLNGVTSQAVTFTVTGGALVSIAISNPYPSTGIGVKQQFQATGTYSDGTTANLTSSVTWNTSSAAVTINASGLATSVAAGTSNITAQFYGVTSTISTLTVTSATISTVTILPNTTTTLPDGVKQQFTATGTYSDGTAYDLTSSVTWNTSSTANVGISNAAGSVGLATANQVSNNTNISATYLTITSAITTVNVSAAVLQSIAITPTSKTIAKGLTQAYTATGTYSDGTTPDITNSVTWASSDPAVATINSSTGVTTVAAASGTTNVTASLNGVTSNTAILTASAAVLQSIAITPGSATVAKGLTQAYTATGTYSDGTTPDITNSVTWASSNPAVAGINASSGVATVVAASGSSNITAVIGGVTSNTAVLTGSAATLVSIAVTPLNPTLALNTGFVQLTATGTYTDTTTSDITSSVTWSSANTGVVSTPGVSGIAVLYSVGSSMVTATSGGKSGTSNITVQ
ncbi:MAG: Ig-like domain-containing protein [Neisseriales bacterium]|nr:MAG: Ig-like domain-containing protein [Neisseriales bacterium]